MNVVAHANMTAKKSCKSSDTNEDTKPDTTNAEDSKKKSKKKKLAPEALVAALNKHESLQLVETQLVIGVDGKAVNVQAQKSKDVLHLHLEDLDSHRGSEVRHSLFR